MNKSYYTCYFKSLKIGKKILKDLIFVSLNGQKWLELDIGSVPKATIEDYKKVEKLFQPVKNKDGSISGHMTIDISVLKQAHEFDKNIKNWDDNQKLEIKEVVLSIEERA